MSYITDADGDRWPITDHWCSICRWPLHNVHTQAGETTHPTCEPGNAPEDPYTTRHRRTIPSHSPAGPPDPGYCPTCGMTRPRHTARCATRKEKP